MVDALDLLQCPTCGTWYKPKIAPTGRTVPHCLKPYAPEEHKELTRVEWLDGEVVIDWAATERRVLAMYGLTEDVVDPPLTGSILDIEV